MTITVVVHILINFDIKYSFNCLLKIVCLGYIPKHPKFSKWFTYENWCVSNGTDVWLQLICTTTLYFVI